MTNHSVSGSGWIVSEFRVGRIFDRTISIYVRNFLPFSAVTLIACAAPMLVTAYAGSLSFFSVPAIGANGILLTTTVTVVLALLSQSILVYSAFQVLRGRPVNLLESARIGFRRFFPVLGLTIFVVLAIFLFVVGISLVIAFTTSRFGQYPSFLPPIIILLVGFLSLVITGLMLVARWFIVIPVCMVERLGPWRSLTRSAGLTQGHRWKVVGIILLVSVPALIIDRVIGVTMTALGGKTV